MEASASVPMSFVSSSASAPNPSVQNTSVPKSMVSACSRVPTSLTILTSDVSISGFGSLSGSIGYEAG